MNEPVHEATGEAPESQGATYQRRAKLGTYALALRTALSQVIILGGTVVLARHLKPADFGTFAMLQFVLTVFTLVGDAGLGGALIQKSAHPSGRELATVFWAQLALSLTVFLAVSSLTLVLPQIWPDLPSSAPTLILALALNFILTSLRVVPTILLERDLLFVRLSILDTLNSITFYLVASILALAGKGVWALVLGVVAQGAVGCISAYLLRPYRPEFAFDGSLVRRLLAFGIPLQARGALTLGTRAAIPVLVGTALGSHAVGEMNWAWENGFFALTFCDILGRVGFPLFSRIRHDRPHLIAEVERTVRVGSAISSFLAAMFFALAHPMTAIIFGTQWLEAEHALRFCAAAMILGGIVNLLAPALDAQGLPRLTLIQMGLTIALEWLLAPLGLKWFGINGFAAATLVAYSAGGLLMIGFARWQFAELPIIRIVGSTGLASAAIGPVGLYFLAPLVRGPLELFAAVVGLVGAFLGALFLLDRRTVMALWATIRPQA